jgi:hypothetical protein
MTSLTDTQVITASGGLVELGYGETDTYATITAASSASMDNLTPEVTVVCDGSPVIVEFYAPIARATQDAAGTGDQLNFVLQYDGSVQEDSWGRVANRSTAIGHLVPVSLQYRMTPTSGSHTFRVGAYVSNASRNGYVGAGTPYPPMFLRVSKIVQATQWPAVTTGTIICTSSTRPASPFEGQVIYETDTGLSLIYDGSAWVSPSVTHKPPSVKLERTTGQVVYDASAAIMVWDSEVWDTDGMHDNATNQDRITINTPGIYLVIGAVRYNAGISDDSSVTIWQNGSTFIVRDEGGPANTAGGRTVSALVNMNANDYLHLQVYQNNSANTSRTTTSGTFFSAAWIGQA